MTEEEIKTPTCPLCGMPPLLAVSLHQAFCGNDGCKALMWDPCAGPDQLAQAEFVDLSFLEPPEPHDG